METVQGKEGSISSAHSSHAEGLYSTASAPAAHAQGNNTIANVYASHAMGQYNRTLTGPSDSFSGTADALVIGNGTPWVARGNAFRVTFDGATFGLSAYNSTGADYAEYFEWLDGNPGNEDRVGFFVTLDGEKIRIATSADTYLLGVVSATPTVIGDSYQDDWNGKYVTDQWGRIQYHYVDVPATLDSNGQIITPARKDYVPIFNPDWNPEIDYIPREQRQEWSPVGMVGKLLVRDDGTCQVNGFCQPNDAGIATASPEGYRVMARVAPNNVRVLVK